MKSEAKRCLVVYGREQSQMDRALNGLISREGTDQILQLCDLPLPQLSAGGASPSSRSVKYKIHFKPVSTDAKDSLTNNTAQINVSLYYREPDCHLYVLEVLTSFEEKQFKSTELGALKAWLEARANRKQEHLLLVRIDASSFKEFNESKGKKIYEKIKSLVNTTRIMRLGGAGGGGQEDLVQAVKGMAQQSLSYKIDLYNQHILYQ